MLRVEPQSIQAPGIGDRILIVPNNSSIPPYFVVENKDGSLSAAIQYEESDDGVTWTQIVGTSASIPPGQSDGQIVTSSRRQIALFAQGNVLLDVSAVRQFNGLNSTLV